MLSSWIVHRVARVNWNHVLFRSIVWLFRRCVALPTWPTPGLHQQFIRLCNRSELRWISAVVLGGGPRQVVASHPSVVSTGLDSRDRVISTVRHLFQELASHPRSYQRLEHELDVCTAPSLPCYWNAAVRETIRLHPLVKGFTWYRVGGTGADYRAHVIPPQASPRCLVTVDSNSVLTKAARA